MPRQPRPIPPDPEGQNDDRAEWAEEAICAFQDRTGCEREDALCDLLTDLRHWCDRNNTSFGSELERATRHYKEETRPITAQDLGANPAPVGIDGMPALPPTIPRDPNDVPF